MGQRVFLSLPHQQLETFKVASKLHQFWLILTPPQLRLKLGRWGMVRDSTIPELYNPCRGGDPWLLPARFINYCSNQTTTQGMPWPNCKPGGSGELPPQTIICIILQISHCQTTSRILTCWKHGTSRDHNNRRILYGIPHMTASGGGQRRNSTHIVVSIHYSEVITEICHSHWKHIKANWATRMCSWDESKRQNG